MRGCVISIAIAWAGCPCALAEEFPTRVCESAAPYHGPPLHAAVGRDVFAGIGGITDRPLESRLAAKLDAAVEWILSNTSAPGLTAAVMIPGRGSWAVSRGLACADPETPLADPHYFHWASAGKAFTSVVVMQLVEQGKLDYASELAIWFPNFPNAKAITIDHLLTHTNGIFSFNADLQVRKQLGYQPPERLIEIAARHGCGFCPGERWRYSNTGYVLLGKIVEVIEGRPLHEVIHARIIKPLGLRQTVALAPGKPPPGLAVGHVDRKPDNQFEPTTPYGAGNIGGSAHDMIRFWHALLLGKILGAASVEQAFARLYPMFEPGLFYGRGVMLVEVPQEDGRKDVWLGHSGGTPGLKSVVAYDVAAGVFVAVALNGNVSAEAAANKLLGEVKTHRAARDGSR